MASQLVESLWRARVNGELVDDPDVTLDLNAAYEQQEQLLACSGCTQVGWKIGSTSPEAQARLGTDEPGAGPLLDRFAFGAGAQVEVHHTHQIFAEVEFAFAMHNTLAPRNQPYIREEVLGAVGPFIPGIELVGSRFGRGLANIGRTLITVDGGGNVAFVGGNKVSAWAPETLPEHRCSLRVNGQGKADGVGARALGDPINVLVWLANHLSSRNRALEAGAIISTGTCTGLVEVQVGDALVGDFGELGEVAFSLVEYSPK